MKNLRFYTLALVCFLTSLTAFAQISVTTENDATALANSLIGAGSGITIVSATYIGDSISSGIFSGGDFGITEGILLTSGSAQIAVGPNVSGSSTASVQEPGDIDLDALITGFTTQDAAILEITFVPDASSVEFTYVFASEEYNEYVCSNFNDVFAFFVNGGIYANENIALIPGTAPPMPVAINNVNNGSVGANGSPLTCSADQLSNSAFFVDNTGGANIEYDGHTIPLSAVIAVVPGTTYTIKLAIADAGDSALDSGVFLQGESFVAVSCDGGDIAYANTNEETLTFCLNALPAIIGMTNSGAGVNDNYGYLVTDNAGNMVSVHGSAGINTAGLLPGTYTIYGFSYSGNVIGFQSGSPLGNLSASGCFELASNDRTLIIDACVNVDCPNLGLNIGDPCELPVPKGPIQKAMGVVGPNCNCVPVQPGPGCNVWSYYFADIANSGVTDIYDVTLNGNFADLNLIVVSNVEVHIAFNENNHLLYLVRKSDGAVSVVDPQAAVPMMSPWNLLSMNIAGIVTATIDGNNNLIIGSQSLQKIFSVDLGTFVVSPYDNYSPINGGDLEFDDSGALYLASAGSLYLNNIDPTADQFIGSLSTVVKSTGLALTDLGDLISSYVGYNKLRVHSVAAVLLNTYDLRLNGLPHTANFGDMTSGCMEPFDDDVCNNFSTFYVQHGPGISGSDLYAINFNGSDANLTFLTNVQFEAHIAYDAAMDIIYFVHKDGSAVDSYVPSTNTHLGSLPLQAGLTEITAAVFNSVDGFLYVGNGYLDKVYKVNVNTGIHTFFANAPVSGGDLAIKGGTLYLASRTGNTLYEFVGNAPVLVGNIQSFVTGLAEANNADGLITSNYGSVNFIEVNSTTSAVKGSFAAKLNGSPFTLLNGDMAAGCADSPFGPKPAVQNIVSSEKSMLNSYPNPTIGKSEVVFETIATGTTTLEVIDMSGRTVATLFNAVADQDQEYRLSFDGSSLPNGIYIYKLTTKNEVVMSKFMIAR